MKKLFEVEIESQMYVMAENRSQAEKVAREEVEINDNVYELDYFAVEAGTHLLAGFEDTIPYNSDDDKTVGELIEEARAEEQKKEYIKNHYQELPFNP